MSLKVLFIGGAGVISSACTQLAVERGMALSLLNRGQTHRRIPSGVEILQGDIRDKGAIKAVLGNRNSLPLSMRNGARACWAIKRTA
jgi:UDP-glucose 4-epimerase